VTPRRIRVSIQAETDLLSTFVRIGSERPAAAERFLDAVEAAYDRLCEHPQIGTACPELAPALEGLRRWPVPGFPAYLIFCRERDTLLEILWLLHAARSLEAALASEVVRFEEPHEP
jgi:toxin ParE1/3/4